MPKYVNQFRSPEYVEQTIVDQQGGVVGTIRLKPSGVSWRPKSAKKFFGVSLDAFTEWITSAEAGAAKKKS